MTPTSIYTSNNEAGERLDLFLAKRFPDYSRNYFGNLIKNGNVLVDNKKAKPSFLLKADQKIEIDFKEHSVAEIKPIEIPLEIIYEDADVIVINKQPGIVVHPGAGNTENTLVHGLIHHFPEIKNALIDGREEIGKLRPGIVHRLDKDTSGVMIVAKNSRAMHSLSRQIQNRTISKKYLSLCFGWPKEEKSVLTNYLGRDPKNRQRIADVGEEKGKEAISFYKTLRFFKDRKENKISLIEFDIKTGRTHQIRVQSKLIGCPVLGDNVYGTKDSIKTSIELHIKRQLLHAKSLAITLPGENKPRLFEAPLPNDLIITLENIQEIKS